VGRIGTKSTKYYRDTGGERKARGNPSLGTSGDSRHISSMTWPAGKLDYPLPFSNTRWDKEYLDVCVDLGGG